MKNRQEYFKNYYIANKEKLIEQSKTIYKLNREARRDYRINYNKKNNRRLKSQVAIRREIISKAKDKPCMDCKVPYPSYIMQFDHRDPTIKLFAIGSYGSRNIQKLQAEIDKCDVVCSNCHAERTWGKRS